MKPITTITTVLALASAAVYADSTTVSERDYQLPKCAKPVASVVVGKIACKSAACQTSQDAGGNSQLAMLARLAAQQSQANFAGIGDGMAAMLTTALKETGCFEIQEREEMDDVAKELALVGKKVQVQQADFMLSGAITSINMSTERKALGGGMIPILGAFSKTTKTADIGVDMKIIDINHAKVLESKTFEANNQTSSTSFGAAAWGGIGLAGGGMSSVKGTPMEPIIRDVLARVASYTSTKLIEARGGVASVARGQDAGPASAAAPSALTAQQ